MLTSYYPPPSIRFKEEAQANPPEPNISLALSPPNLSLLNPPFLSASTSTGSSFFLGPSARLFLCSSSPPLLSLPHTPLSPAMSAAPALKAAAATLSIADGCLTSSALRFTSHAKSCHPVLSLPARPIRLPHLGCSSSPRYPSLLSLRKRSPLATPLVAQTSDWSPQGGSQVEEVTSDWEEGDNGEGVEVTDGVESALSEWEGEDGPVQVEDVMGAAAEAEVYNAEEETYPEPPEEAKLFVGNLPYDMDSEKLAHLFEEAGVVEVAEVIYNRETDQSRGFGFVTMSTVEEAEKAIEKLHRFNIEGRLLTVNKAAPRGSRPERTPRESGPRFRIYVGNLPWSLDDARLEQAFSEYGKVLDSRVVYDRETGRSRGFGFVTMSTQQEMDDAIAGLDGNDLGGRTVRVNAAEQRPM
ncbi:hypothetical protein Taro_017574, partial [Colocasia esculenta]|nr:hypothetical protein [Colocasia esculenta]